MIEGECSIGQVQFARRGLRARASETIHESIQSERGCLLPIVFSVRDEILGSRELAWFVN